MKRITALILALAMLITANCVLAEDTGNTDSSPTKVISYVVGDSGGNSSRTLDSEEYILVTEEDGRYIRYTVYLDEEAKRLYNEYHSDPPKVTWEELMAYIRTLPASLTEELDVVPPTQEELDALAGKTVGEIRAALSAPVGMHDCCYPAGRFEEGENIVLRLECGFFRYAVLVDDPYKEYLACKEADSYDSLTAKRIARIGLCYDATNIYWVSEGVRKAWENAGSEGAPPFKTVREARSALNGDGWFSVSGERMVITAEIDGRFFRYTAFLDEEGKKLYDDYNAAGSDEAARLEVYRKLDRYRAMLPITQAEELTAVPLAQEELDALAGKTLGELEAALSTGDNGFWYYPENLQAAEDRGEEVTFSLDIGIFSYTVTVNETYEECLACKEAGDYSALTVRSAGFKGLSHNSTDPLFRPDGTREPERWVHMEVYNRTGEIIREVEINNADGSHKRMFSYPEAEISGQEKYPIANMNSNITFASIDVIRWVTESGSTFEAPLPLQEGEYIIFLLPEADGLIEVRPAAAAE